MILVGRPEPGLRAIVQNFLYLGKIDQQQLYPLHMYAHCTFLYNYKCVLCGVVIYLAMKSETLCLVLHIPSFRSRVSEITVVRQNILSRESE